MSNTPDHQDWKPVVFSKHPPPRETQDDKPYKPTLDDIEEKVPKKKKVSKDMAMLIQKTRNAKKISRKQLASMCNIKEQTLASYETGKVAIPGNHKNIISRKLGLATLKKKKNKSKSK
jgi:ribosome-binding protein aMBF1 (putative translation factor)